MILNQSVRKKTNKQINIRKSISFLMSMLMFLGMIPFSTGIAYAEERNGITSLDKLEAKEYIYMGVQGSGLQGAGKEIKWRVLDKNDNNGTEHGLFLLSEELLGSGNDGGVKFYNSMPFQPDWQGSDAQKWCKEFSGEVLGATTSLDPKELDAILSIEKTDKGYKDASGFDYKDMKKILDKDKVFFLSPREVEKEYLINTDERKGKYNNDVGKWWLRYPSFYAARIVDANGETGNESFTNPLPVRPAFNLEKSKVMYISPAEDGKNKNEVGALEKVASTNTTEWKLTLKDSARGSFTASKSKQHGMEVTINYDNAKTGTNEYLSAVVTDKSNTEIKYYGRIEKLENGNENGTVEIDLNGKFEDGDKLFVFNEQYNGDKKTDYSSDRKEIEGISVKKFHTVYVSSNDTVKGTVTSGSVPNVEDDTHIEANENELKVGSTIVVANEKPGYRFKEWTGIPEDGKVTDTITIVAVFEEIPQEKYTVTVQSNDETMGTVSKDKVEHIVKDTMISAVGHELLVGTEKITATAKPGYRFKEWTGIPADGKVTRNITVKAVFEDRGSKDSSNKDKDRQKYIIEKEKMNHGTVTVKSEGRYGEEITIIAEPDRGYEVDKIKVTDDSGKDIEVTEKKENSYAFSMPRRKVTVEATFKKIERPSNNNGQNPNDYMQKQKEIKTTVFTVGSNMVKYTVIGETQHASERQIDAKPFIQDGRTMIPIRYVAESLGMKVMWNKQSKIVTLQDEERKVEIVTNGKKIVVNGKEYVSDVAPVIENGRTYLSISNIGKVSGAKVTWNPQSKQVSVTK